MAMGRVVGRPGLEPGTTGLKVHRAFNGDMGFQHHPSPILARLGLERTKAECPTVLHILRMSMTGNNSSFYEWAA